MTRPNIVNLELEDLPDTHSNTEKYILALEKRLRDQEILLKMAATTLKSARLKMARWDEYPGGKEALSALINAGY